jgi:hypothetical protein
MGKISLWKRRLQAGNFSSFPQLNKLLYEMEDLDQNYLNQRSRIISHLDFLAEDFMHYFPDNTLDNPVWKLVGNSFNIDVDSSPDPVHVQAVKLKSD